MRERTWDTAVRKDSLRRRLPVRTTGTPAPTTSSSTVTSRINQTGTAITVLRSDEALTGRYDRGMSFPVG